MCGQCETGDRRLAAGVGRPWPCLSVTQGISHAAHPTGPRLTSVAHELRINPPAGRICLLEHFEAACDVSRMLYERCAEPWGRGILPSTRPSTFCLVPEDPCSRTPQIAASRSRPQHLVWSGPYLCARRDSNPQPSDP